MLLPDEAGAGAAGGEADNPTGGEAEAGLPVNDPNGEGTTPEEVSQVLKSSGMNLPDEVKANDDEEGEDPDTPVADEPGKPDKDVEEEIEEAAEPEQKPKPQPEQKAPEAAEDQADKYPFQIEDANGVTYKITAEADIEEVLAEFDPKNNGQIINILDQLREVKEQKKADDAASAEQTAKAEREEQTNKLLEGWGEEAKSLQGAKRIPDGDDGQKRIDAVFAYMVDENTKRMESGKPTINSFEDALDKLENKEAREKVVADKKTAKEEARKNGSLVGGSSAAASTAPSVYKAGSARNPNEALRAMGLLK